MPHRLPLLLLLLLFTLPLPACSLPRGIGMHCLGIVNSPLPPNAQRTEFHNHPFYTMGDPGISTTIHTHDPAQPTLAFYRQALEQRGWTESPASATLGPPPATSRNATTTSYYFQRQSTLSLGTCQWTYAREKIRLDINDDRFFNPSQNLTIVRIYLNGHYDWDIPSDAAAKSIVALTRGAPNLFLLSMPF